MTSIGSQVAYYCSNLWIDKGKGQYDPCGNRIVLETLMKIHIL